MIKFIKENSYNIFRLFLSQIALAVFSLVMTVWTTKMNYTVFMTVAALCIFFYVYLIYIIAHDIGAKDRPPVEAGRAKPQYLKGLWLGISANIIHIICGVMIFVFGFFLVYQQPVKVYDESGEQIKLYVKTDDKGTIAELTELYSDTGDDVFTYDRDNYMREAHLRGGTSGTVTPVDADGNELILYSKSGDEINLSKNIVKNWASDLYGVPRAIATFVQSMFKSLFFTFFGEATWYYLIFPLPTTLACALGYYLGVKGKRILFFLPERKDPKRVRNRY